MLSSDEYKPLYVIGTGLMRTGTNSLRLALERLLHGKCYHMHYVTDYPDRVDFWLRALKQTPFDDDFRRHFQDFSAVLDFPAVSFYELMLQVFPHAKVILTLRDPHEWFASFSKTIGPNIKARRNIAATDHPLRHFNDMLEGTIQRLFGHTSYDDEEAMTGAFVRHVENVKKNVPSERLLVYDVKDGWGPLCAFLGLEVPEVSFPLSNTTADFLARNSKLSEIIASL